MSIESIFPTKIYRANFGDINKIENLCNSSFIKNLESGLINGPADSFYGNTIRSTHDDKSVTPHKMDEFKEVVDFINFHAEKYCNELNYFSDVRLALSKSWINISHIGAIVPIHRHYRSPAVAVFYLNAVPGDGNLVFINPLDDVLGLAPIKGGNVLFEIVLEV